MEGAGIRRPPFVAHVFRRCAVPRARHAAAPVA